MGFTSIDLGNPHGNNVCCMKRHNPKGGFPDCGVVRSEAPNILFKVNIWSLPDGTEFLPLEDWKQQFPFEEFANPEAMEAAGWEVD
jgi:hypothetical protein